MCNKLLYCNGLMIEAPVAQLDRASVYGTEGWGSESLQAYFHFIFPGSNLFWSGRGILKLALNWLCFLGPEIGEFYCNTL